MSPLSLYAASPAVFSRTSEIKCLHSDLEICSLLPPFLLEIVGSLPWSVFFVPLNYTSLLNVVSSEIDLVRNTNTQPTTSRNGRTVRIHHQYIATDY